MLTFLAQPDWKYIAPLMENRGNHVESSRIAMRGKAMFVCIGIADFVVTHWPLAPLTPSGLDPHRRDNKTMTNAFVWMLHAPVLLLFLPFSSSLTWPAINIWVQSCSGFLPVKLFLATGTCLGTPGFCVWRSSWLKQMQNYWRWDWTELNADVVFDLHRPQSADEGVGLLVSWWTFISKCKETKETKEDTNTD